MKTDSTETSKILAAYLNSDIGEKLASRRATGGTRPALDYPALLSIPIIYDKRILEIMEAATKKKQAKEQQAKDLLASVDGHLLGELGIKLLEKDNGLEKRIFTSVFSELTGNRFDTYFHKKEFKQLDKQIEESKYGAVNFGSLINRIINGYDFRAYASEGIPYVRVANIKPGSFDLNDVSYVNFSSSDLSKDIGLREGNLLFTRKGTFGVALALEKDAEYIISSEIFNIQLKMDRVNVYFLESYLNSSLGTLQSDRYKIGAIMGSLTQDAVKKIKIVPPPIEIQNEIADHIRQLREQAKQLQQEAEKELEKVSQKVEELILGNSNEIK